MQEPDQWKDIVWHVYSEVYRPGDVDKSTRGERLERCPDAVFTAPTEVADWIEDMTRRKASRYTVHLIGGGIAETADAGQRQRDRGENLEVLHRGDSVYIDFHYGRSRMHLWVEAIHEEEREVRQSIRGE